MAFIAILIWTVAVALIWPVAVAIALLFFKLVTREMPKPPEPKPPEKK